MIPVNSILEVGESWGSFGVSYLSNAFDNGITPKRMTYVPVRDLNGITVSFYFVPSEVL